jgi:hypothetical protein
MWLPKPVFQATARYGIGANPPTVPVSDAPGQDLPGINCRIRQLLPAQFGKRH